MDDPFDQLLNFEEQYYDEGYQQGYKDGLQQSKQEAKLFGIEKGFEKFITMGKLQARARLWAFRLASHPEKALPPLPHSARVEKHLVVLLALIDPLTLSLANTDDAVADFDDRLKRAQAKEKIIEKIVGEDAGTSRFSNGGTQGGVSDATDMESFARTLK